MPNPLESMLFQRRAQLENDRQMKYEREARDAQMMLENHRFQEEKKDKEHSRKMKEAELEAKHLQILGRDKPSYDDPDMARSAELGAQQGEYETYQGQQASAAETAKAQQELATKAYIEGLRGKAAGERADTAARSRIGAARIGKDKAVETTEMRTESAERIAAMRRVAGSMTNALMKSPIGAGLLAQFKATTSKYDKAMTGYHRKEQEEAAAELEVLVSAMMKHATDLEARRGGASGTLPAPEADGGFSFEQDMQTYGSPSAPVGELAPPPTTLSKEERRARRFPQ